MLFISRITEDEFITPVTIDDNVRYGVVDTDDDVETLVDIQQLSDAVFQYGLEIKGVKVKCDDTRRYINEVEISQDPKYLTGKQAKLKSLMGVDLFVYKGDITLVIADGFVSQHNDVVIRLSDYGKRMEWCIPVGWIHHRDINKLILVIDDKIEMVGQTPRLGGLYVRYDIREVTNDALIERIYRSLMEDDTNPPSLWTNYVIDKQERMTYWIMMFYTGG